VAGVTDFLDEIGLQLFPRLLRIPFLSQLTTFQVINNKERWLVFCRKSYRAGFSSIHLKKQCGLKVFVLDGFYLHPFWQGLSKFFSNFRRGGDRCEKVLKEGQALILSKSIKQLASAITALYVRGIVNHIFYGVIDDRHAVIG
jgi:hypothetical protein